MKFQMVSDLHLRFVPKDKLTDIITPKCDTLFILGDLDEISIRETWKSYLIHLSKKFKTIYYVFGNHEYYTGEQPKTRQEIESIFDEWVSKQKIDNIIRLHEDCLIKMEDCWIVGMTLWSYIPEEEWKIIQQSVADYRYIKDKDSAITPKKTNEWHEEQLETLEIYATEADEAKVPLLVMTHHAPLMKNTSFKKYENNEISHAFCTDLSRFMRQHPCIQFWGFGHTHYQCDFMFGHTRIKSNALGYVDCHEASVERFKKDDVITFPK